MLSYEEHVSEIVQFFSIAPEDILPRLLDGVRERVRGEMYVEVMERHQASKEG